jgi:hypothetical protein
MVRAKPSQLQ